MRSLLRRTDHARRPPPSDRGVRVRPHGTQGRRRRQRRHPCLDPCCSSAATTATRCSCRSKEAEASVLERFVGKSEYDHHGERVVVGQRLMQAASDIFLGWLRVRGSTASTRDYYVRQLHDWKGGADVESMRVPGATLYARLCGATLARAHARWGDRIAIASYLGKGNAFDRAIADFAAAYADQNERDYDAFVKRRQVRAPYGADRPLTTRTGMSTRTRRRTPGARAANRGASRNGTWSPRSPSTRYSRWWIATGRWAAESWPARSPTASSSAVAVRAGRRRRPRSDVAGRLRIA